MSNDLSIKHKLISDLFSWPSTSEQWDELRIDQKQIHFFHKHGYLAGIRLLNEPQIDALRNELADLVQPGQDGSELWYEYNSNESADPDRVLFHALGAWRIRPGFHDLLWNPKMLVVASQLLGGSVRFWHDQLFCKPAKHGGVVAWHQDYSYWTRTTPMNHLTCWIGLDDSTIDNGCVNYVPGSHEWDLLPITGLAGDMDAIAAVLNEQQLERFKNPVAVELKAGECSFHHPLMIHGSRENRTNNPRRAAVVNLVRDGVSSATDEALLKGVPPLANGQPLGGQFSRFCSIAQQYS